MGRFLWVLLVVGALFATELVVSAFSETYKAFEKRRPKVHRVVLVVSACVLIALATVTYPFGGSAASSPAGQTDVETVAVERFADRPKNSELPLDCVTTDGGSLRADRPGTLTCFPVAIGQGGSGSDLGGAVRDPCFPLDTFSVVCADSNGEFERYAVVGLPERSALRSPTAGAWPWGLQLSDGTFCVWALTEAMNLNRAGADPTYTCAPMVYTAVVTLSPNPQGGFDEIRLDAVVPLVDVVVSAKNLDQLSETKWTVEFSSDGVNFRTVPVDTVWF